LPAPLCRLPIDRAGEAGATGPSTLTSDPTTTSASASNPSPEAGHAPTPFFRAAFRYPFELSRLGRIDLGPSLVGRPAALLGFFGPFAGFIPPAGEMTFLPPRAHVSLASRVPPRLVFVGVTDRLGKNDGHARAVGRGFESLDFWASLPSAVRCVTHVRSHSDPALGFASLRVVGHVSAHPSGIDTTRITSLRNRPTA